MLAARCSLRCAIQQGSRGGVTSSVRARSPKRLLLRRVAGGVALLAGSGATVALSQGYGLLRDGVSYGPIDDSRQREQEHAVKASEEESLPLIPLDDVRAHSDEESCWVCYGGVVYDVTTFLHEHPGGLDTLLHAAGQDLEAFWDKYPIHYKKDVLSILQPYRIGRLSDADAECAQNSADTENVGLAPAFLRNKEGQEKAQSSKWRSALLARAQLRSQRHFAEVALVGPTMPVWGGCRWALRFLAPMKNQFLFPFPDLRPVKKRTASSTAVTRDTHTSRSGAVDRRLERSFECRRGCTGPRHGAC